MPGPRRWLKTQRRYGAAVPKTVWAFSYILFLLAILAAIYVGSFAWSNGL